MAKEINLLEKQLLFPDFSDKLEETIKVNERGLKTQIKKVIEALLFACHEPLSFNKIREILETKLTFKPKLLKSALEDLQEDYIQQQRSFLLEETVDGFILKTRTEFAVYIDQLFRNKRGEKLSSAAIEVLAIIAYKQPITKPQIDAIRGVDCSGTIQNLLERELIQPAGKLDAPGKPTLYGITSHFLAHFGLKDLTELPNAFLESN